MTLLGALAGIGVGARGEQVAAVGEPSGAMRRSALLTATHVLPAGRADATKAFVLATLNRIDEEASVRHVFVAAPSTLDAETAETIVKSGAMLEIDADGARASGLRVDSGLRVNDAVTVYPTTIVTEADGGELFRRVGQEARDFISFDVFSRRLRDAAPATVAQHSNVARGSRLAIQGYDPVAYFRSGKAERGSDAIVSRHRGVEYRFVTAEHRRLFALDPERYQPTYGGWCASAMGAKGEKVEIDPRSFKIKDGRLHLFYKDLFSDALSDWNKHEREWEPAADANWARLTGERKRVPDAAQ